MRDNHKVEQDLIAAGGVFLRHSGKGHALYLLDGKVVTISHGNPATRGIQNKLAEIRRIVRRRLAV